MLALVELYIRISHRLLPSSWWSMLVSTFWMESVHLQELKWQVLLCHSRSKNRNTIKKITSQLESGASIEAGSKSIQGCWYSWSRCCNWQPTDGFQGTHEDKKWISEKREGDRFQSDSVNVEGGNTWAFYFQNQSPPPKWINKGFVSTTLSSHVINWAIRHKASLHLHG